MKRRGFTLVELLVVIGIIALLLSLLMPALAGARRAAIGSQCADNLRKIGMAEIAYAVDHQGQLTPCLFVKSGTNECWPAVWPLEVWKSFGEQYGLSAGDTIIDNVSTPSGTQTYTYKSSITMLCPATENYWSIYYPNDGWGPVFNGGYMYVGNPAFPPNDPAGYGGALNSASYWKDYKLIPKHVGEAKASEKFLAGDIVTTPASSGGQFSTNHRFVGMTSDHRTFTGANQLFLDGHVAWKPSADFPPAFDGEYGPAGNASFVHWPGNPYALYW